MKKLMSVAIAALFAASTGYVFAQAKAEKADAKGAKAESKAEAKAEAKKDDKGAKK